MKDMSMGRKGVSIQISPTGDTRIEGENFSSSDGSKCKTLADGLVSALGGSVVSQELKPEFSASASAGESAYQD